MEKANHRSHTKTVGFSFCDSHCALYIKVLQFLISEVSTRLYLWLLGDHLGNILSLYLTVVYELGGCRSELRAARQKMATGAMRAVANEQQRIIFKGPLKINCAVPLTQSPNCCMVKSHRLHFTAVQLPFDEHCFFFDGLQIALQLLFESSSYVMSHLYVTRFQ